MRKVYQLVGMTKARDEETVETIYIKVSLHFDLDLLLTILYYWLFKRGEVLQTSAVAPVKAK